MNPVKNPKWITAEVNGGLGNQLFQIFNAIAFSLKINSSFYFKYEPRILGHASVRETYWNTLLSDMSNNVLRDETELARRNSDRIVIHEDGHHYSPINPPELDQMFPEVLCLAGYFQSYKYFQEYFEQITILTGIRKKQAEFRRECRDRDYTIGNISMHFRLGDYQKLTDIHPIIPKEYYRNALRYLVNHINTNGTTTPRNQEGKITVVYFCEVMDHNYVVEHYIKYLVELFPECEFVLADQRLVDWKQMLYMSLCDHNIIGNSTFSLWGAMLNTSQKKQVCYPWKWFTDAFVRRDKRFVHDMFPPEWKKVGWLFHVEQYGDYVY